MGVTTNRKNETAYASNMYSNMRVGLPIFGSVERSTAPCGVFAVSVQQ
jgi:hypothetical protein